MALAAGATATEAALPAVSMILLQFGIGAANDVVDAPRDAGRKPDKPIPAGLVSRSTAAAIGVACSTLGVVVAAAHGMPLAGLAAVVLAIGLAYDLWLNGTRWSWVPFAVGIPILPIYGWLAARSALPELTPLILAVAFLEGAALALANGLVDVERDRGAGDASAASSLGLPRAAWVGLAIQDVVVMAAVITGWGIGLTRGSIMVAAVGSLAVLAGAGTSLLAARSSDPSAIERRELGWRIQAIGAAILAFAWISGAAQLGRL